jgi:hypothetical protein
MAIGGGPRGARARAKTGFKTFKMRWRLKGTLFLRMQGRADKTLFDAADVLLDELKAVICRRAILNSTAKTLRLSGALKRAKGSYPLKIKRYHKHVATRRFGGVHLPAIPRVVLFRQANVAQINKRRWMQAADIGKCHCHSRQSCDSDTSVAPELPSSLARQQISCRASP